MLVAANFEGCGLEQALARVFGERIDVSCVDAQYGRAAVPGVVHDTIGMGPK
jgi:hypothetical protein